MTSDNQTIINKKRQDDLFLMHFNIRSLQKHINELNNIIAGFDDKPKIIAISETKLQEGKIYGNIKLDGYQFIHRDSITSASGVGLYISNSLVFSVNPCSNLRLSNAEHLWVDLKTNQGIVVVGVVYRHPENSTHAIDDFNANLNMLILSLEKPFYCLGDFNINLLNIYARDEIRRYANMLLGCNCRCLIDVPTRVTETSKTLIDHVITNDKQRAVTTGVLISDLSDHYGVFAIISHIDIKNKISNQLFIRDMTQFILDNFLLALNYELYSLFEDKSKNVNELYEGFEEAFTNLVDQFAPLRTATRKEKKLGFKPWITSDLIKSIRIKNKMFDRLHKNKGDLVLTKHYKTFRNALRRKLKQAKLDYYHHLLNKNKGNAKKTWDVINELTNIKRRSNVQPSKLKLNNDNTVSEPQIIAEEFNRFFVYIGKEMAASIQPNDSNSVECSVGEKKKITNSIFLLPSCQQESFNLIKELKNRKATRTLDIETKFIKP